MESYLVFAILFLLPFLVWPFGPSQFELPKVIDFVGLNFLLAGVFFFKRKFDFKNSFNTLQISLSGVIFGLTLIDLIFLNTPLSFFGNQTRFQGIFLLWNLLLFSLISSKIPLPKVKPIIYLSIIAAIFILSLFMGNQIGRAVATAGEPNNLAGFVLFLWPFAYFSKDDNNKYLKMVSILIAFLIIILTGSRSGLIGFGVQFAFLIGNEFFKLNRKILFIIPLILVALSLILPIFDKSVYENRAQIWRTATIAAYSNPIFGAGFGNTEIIFRQTSIKLYDNLRGYYVDSAHNLFLDWFIQGGFVGLTVIVLLIYFAVKNYYIKKKNFEYTLFLGLLTILLFNPANIVTLICLWWILGQGFKKESKNLNNMN